MLKVMYGCIECQISVQNRYQVTSSPDYWTRRKKEPRVEILDADFSLQIELLCKPIERLNAQITCDPIHTFPALSGINFL